MEATTSQLLLDDQMRYFLLPQPLLAYPLPLPQVAVLVELWRAAEHSHMAKLQGYRIVAGFGQVHSQVSQKSYLVKRCLGLASLPGKEGLALTQAAVLHTLVLTLLDPSKGPIEKQFTLEGGLQQSTHTRPQQTGATCSHSQMTVIMRKMQLTGCCAACVVAAAAAVHITLGQATASHTTGPSRYMFKLPATSGGAAPGKTRRHTQLCMVERSPTPLCSNKSNLSPFHAAFFLT
jgi:hypothetical protein